MDIFLSLKQVLLWIDSLLVFEMVIELKEESLFKTKSLNFLNRLSQELQELACEIERCSDSKAEILNLDSYQILMNRLELISTTNLEECVIWDWFKLARDGDFTKVELLLWLDSDPNSVDKNGQTVLHVASRMNHLEVVRLLLDRGANINSVDKDGQTALYLASEENHLKIVQLLLDRGANINFINEEYNTVLNWASATGHLEIVQLILDREVDISFVNISLKWASSNGKIEIVRFLLDRGSDSVDRQIDLNDSDENGTTALHLASSYNNLDIVQLLLDRGANRS